MEVKGTPHFHAPKHHRFRSTDFFHNRVLVVRRFAGLAANIVGLFKKRKRVVVAPTLDGSRVVGIAFGAHSESAAPALATPVHEHTVFSVTRVTFPGFGDAQRKSVARRVERMVVDPPAQAVPTGFVDEATADMAAICYAVGVWRQTCEAPSTLGFMDACWSHWDSIVACEPDDTGVVFVYSRGAPSRKQN